MEAILIAGVALRGAYRFDVPGAKNVKITAKMRLGGPMGAKERAFIDCAHKIHAFNTP